MIIPTSAELDFLEISHNLINFVDTKLVKKKYNASNRYQEIRLLQFFRKCFVQYCALLKLEKFLLLELWKLILWYLNPSSIWDFMLCSLCFDTFFDGWDSNFLIQLMLRLQCVDFLMRRWRDNKIPRLKNRRFQKKIEMRVCFS